MAQYLLWFREKQGRDKNSFHQIYWYELGAFVDVDEWVVQKVLF